MIKKLFVLGCLLYGSWSCSAQQQEKVAVSFFDTDSRLDSLYYRYAFDSVEGPVYKVRLVPGAGKPRSFSIGVGFESMQITGCGKGCIETYQLKAGNEGYEETAQYRYDAVRNNWLLKTRVTTPEDGGRRQVYRPRVPIGIDGREYPGAKK